MIPMMKLRRRKGPVFKGHEELLIVHFSTSNLLKQAETRKRRA
jgi:hypothetical protein